MASLCKSQQCTIERRGFRQELDSWRHKLIHCVGFESILEGLFGPGLVNDLTLFKDCEPEGVSDWSFDENCLFCCLRREKVKEHLVGLSNQTLEAGEKAIYRQDQSKINRLEKQAEEFLNAVFYRKDVPRVFDPKIPLVAREIMQRMIRQFAAEYTSKTSSPQDSIQPNGTKDQSLPKTSSFAPAENPVLSKLLMADQDSPLDLTVKKVETESSDQDGVLDLSTKRSPSTGCTFSNTPPNYSSAFLGKGRPGRADHSYRDGHSQDADGLSQRSLQDGMREGYSHSSPIKPPLARSLQIKEELQSRKQQLQQPPVSLANLESMGMVNHRQQLSVSRESSWNKPHFDNHLKFRGNSAINELKDLPFLLENSCAYPKVPAQLKIQEGKRDSAYSAPVDLKIPQVRGMDLSWDSHGSDLYGYGSLVVGSHSENALNKKLRAILPKQNRRGGRGRGILDGGPDFWGSDAEQSTSGQQYPTSDHEGDPNSKQPRKKRGRYRQYNSEILEEAISVVMSGKMSVSKAQNIYGIPHSTLEYKVKERLGTLKNPPKKKMKLMRMEGQEVVAESDPSPRGEGSQGINDSKDD
ncbi:ligand-dependent corepressor-like isoform X3 [Polypterus senegalus]|uniref:ligand-dependent corepressor-like isoform X3 n=1 Tax=Polypterus senegalus TaxID=55291 RepID=UPI0019634418|nr:ligand-dependent corepressor-like isoform X3 [Polypterus senegalus]